MLEAAAALRWRRPRLTADLAHQVVQDAAAAGDGALWLRSAGWYLHGRAATEDAREAAVEILTSADSFPGGAGIDDADGARLRVELAAIAQANGDIDEARALVGGSEVAATRSGPDGIELDRAAVLVRCALAEPGGDPERLRRSVEGLGRRLRGEPAALAELLVGSIHRAGDDQRAASASALSGLANLGWTPDTPDNPPASPHLAAALFSQWITALLDGGSSDDVAAAVRAVRDQQELPDSGRQGVLLRLTLTRALPDTAERTAAALRDVADRAARAGAPSLEAACRATQAEVHEGVGDFREALSALRAGMVAERVDRECGQRFRDALAAVMASRSGSAVRTGRADGVEHGPVRGPRVDGPRPDGPPIGGPPIDGPRPEDVDASGPGVDGPGDGPVPEVPVPAPAPGRRRRAETSAPSALVSGDGRHSGAAVAHDAAIEATGSDGGEAVGGGVHDLPGPVAASRSAGGGQPLLVDATTTGSSSIDSSSDVTTGAGAHLLEWAERSWYGPGQLARPDAAIDSGAPLADAMVEELRTAALRRSVPSLGSALHRSGSDPGGSAHENAPGTEASGSGGDGAGPDGSRPDRDGIDGIAGDRSGDHATGRGDSGRGSGDGSSGRDGNDDSRDGNVTGGGVTGGDVTGSDGSDGSGDDANGSQAGDGSGGDRSSGDDGSVAAAEIVRREPWAALLPGARIVPENGRRRLVNGHAERTPELPALRGTVGDGGAGGSQERSVLPPGPPRAVPDDSDRPPLKWQVPAASWASTVFGPTAGSGAPANGSSGATGRRAAHVREPVMGTDVPEPAPQQHGPSAGRNGRRRAAEGVGAGTSDRPVVDVGDYLVVLDLLQGDRPVRDASAAAVLHDVAERARRLVPPRGEIRTRGTDSDDPLGVGEGSDPGRIEVVLPDADRVTAMLWAQSLVGYVAARVGRGGLPEETALRSQVHDTTGPVGLGVVRVLTGPERSEGVVGVPVRSEGTSRSGDPVTGSGSVPEGRSADAEPDDPAGTAGSAVSAGAPSDGETSDGEESAGAVSAGAVSAGGALAGTNGSHAVRGRHGEVRGEDRRAVNGAACPEASAVATRAATPGELPLGPIVGSTDVAGPADVAESSDAALSTPGTTAIDVAGSAGAGGSTGAVGSADAAGSLEADAVPGRHGGQVPWRGAATVQPGSGGRRRRDSSTAARTEGRPKRLAAVAAPGEISLDTRGPAPTTPDSAADPTEDAATTDAGADDTSIDGTTAISDITAIRDATPADDTTAIGDTTTVDDTVANSDTTTVDDTLATSDTTTADDTLADSDAAARGGTTATVVPTAADDASGAVRTAAAGVVADEANAGRRVAGRAVAGARPRRVGPDEERAARVARHAAQRRSRTGRGTDRSADGSEGNGSGPAVDGETGPAVDGETGPAADAGNADRVRAVDPTDIPDDLGMAELLAGALAAYRDI